MCVVVVGAGLMFFLHLLCMVCFQIRENVAYNKRSCWTTSLKGQLLINNPPTIIAFYYYQTVPTAEGSHYTFQTKSLGNNCLSPLPPMPSRKWLNPKISYGLLPGGRNSYGESTLLVTLVLILKYRNFQLQPLLNLNFLEITQESHHLN